MFDVTAIQKAENQLKTYSQFFPKAQADVLQSLLASEESSYVCNLIDSIIQKIESMPSTYETEGQGENAFAILHYFGGACDFYITEKILRTGKIKPLDWAIFAFLNWAISAFPNCSNRLILSLICILPLNPLGS